MLELSLNCSENGTRVFNEDLRSLRLKCSEIGTMNRAPLAAPNELLNCGLGGRRFLPVISYLSPFHLSPGAEYEMYVEATHLLIRARDCAWRAKTRCGGH